MRAGRLQHRITLEAPSQSVASGNASVTWPVQATTWAQMEGIGGTMPGLTMEADYRFTLRFRDDITPRWRLGLVGTTRKFTILRPPLDPDGRGTQIMIYAKEVLS